MKFFLENRVRAGVVLALVIILASIFGTWRSVAMQAGKVEKEFTKEDSFGQTVSSTLADLAYHGQLFADVYEQVIEKDEDSILLRTAAQEIEKRGDDPTALGSEYTGIRRSVQNLYDRLLVEGEYKDEVRAAHMAVESDLSILSKYDDYNAAAKKYNKKTAAFPASLFAGDQAIVFE